MSRSYHKFVLRHDDGCHNGQEHRRYLHVHVPATLQRVTLRPHRKYHRMHGCVGLCICAAEFVRLFIIIGCYEVRISSLSKHYNIMTCVVVRWARTHFKPDWLGDLLRESGGEAGNRRQEQPGKNHHRPL